MMELDVPSPPSPPHSVPLSINMIERGERQKRAKEGKMPTSFVAKIYIYINPGPSSTRILHKFYSLLSITIYTYIYRLSGRANPEAIIA